MRQRSELDVAIEVIHIPGRSTNKDVFQAFVAESERFRAMRRMRGASSISSSKRWPCRSCSCG